MLNGYTQCTCLILNVLLCSKDADEAIIWQMRYLEFLPKECHSLSDVEPESPPERHCHYLESVGVSMLLQPDSSLSGLGQQPS